MSTGDNGMTTRAFFPDDLRRRFELERLLCIITLGKKSLELTKKLADYSPDIWPQ
jgi:hypothetical protein